MADRDRGRPGSHDGHLTEFIHCGHPSVGGTEGRDQHGVGRGKQRVRGIPKRRAGGGGHPRNRLIRLGNGEVLADRTGDIGISGRGRHGVVPGVGRSQVTGRINRGTSSNVGEFHHGLGGSVGEKLGVPVVGQVVRGHQGQGQSHRIHGDRDGSKNGCVVARTRCEGDRDVGKRARIWSK